MDNILAGIQLATTPEALIAILIGLIAGQILGAIPGLTASMAVALLVPYTFYLDPWIGIPMLLGMFKGSLFGSSITAILIKAQNIDEALEILMVNVAGLANKSKPGKIDFILLRLFEIK